jgi:hydrogenase maturation factor
LIVVTTDGYPKSFTTDADFLQVAPDLLRAIRSEGYDAVTGKLSAWLNDASLAGSGDDMSLGLLYRDNVAVNNFGTTATAMRAEAAHAESAIVGGAEKVTQRGWMGWLSPLFGRKEKR